jgi:hypothetical protein
VVGEEGDAQTQRKHTSRGKGQGGSGGQKAIKAQFCLAWVAVGRGKERSEESGSNSIVWCR